MTTSANPVKIVTFPNIHTGYMSHATAGRAAGGTLLTLENAPTKHR